MTNASRVVGRQIAGKLERSMKTGAMALPGAESWEWPSRWPSSWVIVVQNRSQSSRMLVDVGQRQRAKVIAVETVRTHARAVYRKLGLSSRRALVALAQPPAPTVAHPARQRAPSRAATRRPRHV